MWFVLFLLTVFGGVVDEYIFLKRKGERKEIREVCRELREQKFIQKRKNLLTKIGIYDKIEQILGRRGKRNERCSNYEEKEAI
jgi:hypothetical protein